MLKYQDYRIRTKIHTKQLNIAIFNTDNQIYNIYDLKH